MLNSCFFVVKNVYLLVRPTMRNVFKLCVRVRNKSLLWISITPGIVEISTSFNFIKTHCLSAQYLLGYKWPHFFLSQLMLEDVRFILWKVLAKDLKMNTSKNTSSNQELSQNVRLRVWGLQYSAGLGQFKAILFFLENVPSPGSQVQDGFRSFWPLESITGQFFHVLRAMRG